MNEQTEKQQTKTFKTWSLVLGLALGAVLLMFILVSPTLPESTTLDASSSDEYSMIGQKAPDFALLDQNGQLITLADYNDKNLVIFFSEGQMCYPSCWNQTASLGSNPKLNNDKVATLTVVTDTRDMWDEPYQEKPEMLAETMVYDSSKEMSAAYDILNFPSSMHPGDLPGHTYVIVDNDGVIRHIKDDPEMGINDPWLEEKVAELLELI